MIPIVINLFGGWEWLPRYQKAKVLSTNTYRIEWLFVAVQFGQPVVKG